MKHRDCVECGMLFFGRKDESVCPKCEHEFLDDFMTSMGYDIDGNPLDQRRSDGVITENGKVGVV